MAELTGTPSTATPTATPTAEQSTSIPQSPPRRPSLVEMERELGVVRVALSEDYEVVAELGRGGMAVVYLANEKQLEREVAIKVLRAALAADDEFVERFKNEARTAGKLEHPNIVPVYRVGQSGHVIYFVMKYLRGQSLNVVLRERGKLNVAEIRRILLDVAGALGYAARQKVVHRDIKPDNILLDHEGRCVVTDFGIAKAPGGTRTAPGTSLGTPRYMSPEHAQGTPLDGRSDIYSLGVVAFQCLTGRTPFEADDPFAMLYKHINEPLPRPSFDDAAEADLFAVIERMLAKRADDRFQDANELILALGGEVSGPILADASGPLVRAVMIPTMPMTTPLPFTASGRVQRARQRALATWNQLRHRRLFWIEVACVAATLVIGGVLLARSRRNAPPVAGADTTRVMSAALNGTIPGTSPPGVVLPTGVAASLATTSGTEAARTPASNAPAATTAGGATAGGAPAGGAPATNTKTGLASTTTRAAIVQRAVPPRPAPEAYSRCPRLSGANATKNLVLMLDSIPQQTSGARMDVAYDVCGLRDGTPFMAQFTLRKLDQNRFRRLVRATFKPVVIGVADVAAGPRTRHHHVIPLSDMPGGRYALELVITDNNQRKQTATQEFPMAEKPDSAAGPGGDTARP